MTAYTVVDIESCSRLASEAQVLTLAAIKLDDKLDEIDRINLKLRPAYLTRGYADAVKIHGISWEEAQAFPPREIGWRRFLDWSERSTMVFHANRLGEDIKMGYDYAVIAMNLQDLGFTDPSFSHFQLYQLYPERVSTHTLAKKLLSLDSYRLDAICQHFSIPLTHHNAESDCEATAEVFRRLKRWA